MNKQSILETVGNQFTELSLNDFLINILLTIIISYIIGLVYVKFGSSLTNRKKMTQTFVLLSVIVMIVITIVKSSLALSLGLVGALSIVRFRTAVKEAEELVFFFLAIAVGLGLGANQRIITIIGVAVIIIYIVASNIQSAKAMTQQNLILNIIHTNTNSQLNEKEVVDLLKKFSNNIELRRFEHIGNKTELSLDIEFEDFDQILKVRDELKKLGEINFTFIEKY